MVERIVEKSRRAVGLIATLALLGGAVSAQAAPAKKTSVTPAKPGGKTVAVPLFKEGIRQFDKGNYHQALAHFKAAFFHYPSPKIHTRIALCYKWLGNYVKAIEHYEKYLAGSKPKGPKLGKPAVAKLRHAVQKTVTELLKKVGQLVITVTAPKGAVVRINGAVVGKAPLKKRLRYKPGFLHITVTAKKHQPLARDVRLRASQTVTVALKPKPIKKKVRSDGAAADDI